MNSKRCNSSWYFPAFLLFIALLSCTTQDSSSSVDSQSFVADIQIQPQWIMNDSLSACETVIFDQKNRCYYVSNSLEYAFTGTGFLSKIDFDGQLIKAKWIDSLNRPTGMAIEGNNLYVGDMDKVVKVDTDRGVVVQTYKAESESFPGINDVAISPDGEVFATGSAVHSIFKLEGDVLQRWTQDTVMLKWANGILAEEDRLVVAGWGLSAVDYVSRNVTPVIESNNIKDLDGITSDGSGGYFISSAGPGINTIWHLDKELSESVLLRRGYYNGDFDYVSESGRLTVPSGNHGLQEFAVTQYNLTFNEED